MVNGTLRCAMYGRDVLIRLAPFIICRWRHFVQGSGMYCRRESVRKGNGELTIYVNASRADIVEY